MTSPINRRTFLLSVAAIAGGAALGACNRPLPQSGGGESAAVPTSIDSTKPATILMWSGQADDANETLKKVAKAFMAKHSNVTIDVQSGASSTEELLQKLSAGFAANRYPDISYAFGSWGSELEASGRTLDITEQVKDPSVKWEEFANSGRETARPLGEKTIGFPAIVDNLSLFYNKTVFDAAGVDYPTDQWTWDDFRAAAKKLTNPDKKIYGYGYGVSGSEETTWQFWPHLWQHGGEILSEDRKTATFDSQAGIDALTFLRGMAVDDKSIYLDQTDSQFGTMFANNKIGMITSGPWMLWDFKELKTKYGIVSLPAFNGSHQTVSGADLWVLFDHGDDVRAYWTFEFAKFLTSEEGDLMWNVAMGNLPLRQSEIDSEAFAKQVKEFPGLDIIAKNAETLKQPRPTVAGYVGLSAAIGKAISQVLQGKGDPAEALHKAAKDATEALNE